ncbi:type II toxin-antitoxin system HicB family antitoxin [Endozoicomonas lisbonensis]|uniref:RNase H-like HicB family nuclease n=1 Tax=Endozoicomonas lisbonensis TaxID=3120522 RepID=A0ABV2SPC0_9GAMM
MKLQYPAYITRCENSYLVKFPCFGWGATEGKTLQQALCEAVDCLDELIAATMLEGEPLPAPQDIEADNIYMVAPSAPMAAKAALYQQSMEAQTRIESGEEKTFSHAEVGEWLKAKGML